MRTIHIKIFILDVLNPFFVPPRFRLCVIPGYASPENKYNWIERLIDSKYSNEYNRNVSNCNYIFKKIMSDIRFTSKLW